MTGVPRAKDSSCVMPKASEFAIEGNKKHFIFFNKKHFSSSLRNLLMKMTLESCSCFMMFAI
ncbi:hypothetical protein BvCmsOUP043_01198 [Escherichia coli]|nr:hypothetical protein BvCmsOUP043_01198 [Escherichia coli]